MSLAQMKRIKDPKTCAILFANFDRNGTYGYIGASILAEISVGFAFGKKIFLFSDIPSQRVADELNAWDVVPLNGDLTPLLRTYRGSCREATAQLRFPEF
jgi:hypothetical protein